MLYKFYAMCSVFNQRLGMRTVARRPHEYRGSMLIYVPVSDCLDRGPSALLYPGAYNTVKMALYSIGYSYICIVPNVARVSGFPHS